MWVLGFEVASRIEETCDVPTRTRARIDIEDVYQQFVVIMSQMRLTPDILRVVPPGISETSCDAAPSL
jgi:hypothetical protein